ncbi:MAG: iron-containing alcohol dehydrogenase [Eubacteriaceae bacterium]
MSIFTKWKYYTPRKKVFGIDTIDNLGSHIREENINGKAIILSDAGVIEAGITGRAVDALKKANYKVKVFKLPCIEPTTYSCDKAIEFARNNNGAFVVGLGGGSSIDTAKVVAQLLRIDGKTYDHLKNRTFLKKGAPIIAIPTTSGTGSEMTQIAVISYADSKEKSSFSTPFIIPDIAIIDPSLTLSMPPGITSISAADALSHAIESMMSRNENMYNDTLAFKAIELIGESAPKAVYDGTNLEARTKMAYGAMFAGMAFNRIGVVEGHAFARALGSIYHQPHGLCCGLSLPYVMEYHFSHCKEKWAKISQLFGYSIPNMNIHNAAIEGIKAITDLLIEIGNPLTWRSFGEQKDIPKLVDYLLENPQTSSIWKNNSKRILNKETATELITRIYKRELGKGVF